MSHYIIDEKLVRYLAKVARLELSQEEQEKYVQQLKVILDSFKEIDEVDTTDIEPSFHPMEINDVLRKDQVKEWEWDPLVNTKHKEKRYFKGPRII